MVMWIATTKTQVAEFFGVSLANLSSSWGPRGCPLEKLDHDGVEGYDLQAIAQWRLQYLASLRRPTEEEILFDSTGPDVDHWKAEWTKNRAQLAGEELCKIKGQLVDLDEIAPVLSRTGVVLSNCVRELEAKYGMDAAEIMRTPVRRATEELETLVGGD